MHFVDDEWNVQQRLIRLQVLATTQTTTRECLRAAHDIGSSACFCRFLTNSQSDSPPSSSHSPIYVLLWLFAILDKFYSLFVFYCCLKTGPQCMAAINSFWHLEGETYSARNSWWSKEIMHYHLYHFSASY